MGELTLDRLRELSEMLGMQEVVDDIDLEKRIEELERENERLREHLVLIERVANSSKAWGIRSVARDALGIKPS